MSVITEEILEKAWDVFYTFDKPIWDKMRAALNAVLPDILDAATEAMDQVENEALAYTVDMTPEAERTAKDMAAAFREAIRALSEETGTVQEK